MSTPAEAAQDPDVAVLRGLPRLVHACGYVDAYVIYGAVHLRRDVLRRELPSLPPRLQALVALFALEEWVPQQELLPTLAQEDIEALLRLGVLLRRDEDEALSCGGMVLLPVLGHLAFLPSPGGNPFTFFGDDTIALLARMGGPARAARALVPYAGPGTTALHASGSCDSIVAIEHSEVAGACAELNLLMNDLEDRIELRAGLGLAALHPGEQFDSVCANPPLLPLPPQLFQAVPGEEPLAEATAFLQRLPEVLTKGGVAQVVCTDLGGPEGPGLLGPLAQIAQQHDLAIVVSVPSSAALGTSLLDKLLRVVPGEVSPQQARERAAAYLSRHDWDRLFMMWLTITAAPRQAGLFVSRQDTWGKGFWFR